MKKFLLSFFVCVLAFTYVNAQTQYYVETFETGDGSGWIGEDEWTFGNTTSTASQYVAFNGNDTEYVVFNDDGAGGSHVGGGRLTSPAIDLTAATGQLYLEAYVFFVNGDYQGADETLTLNVSSDGGATWTELENYGGQAWTRMVYDFSAYAGETVMISFNYMDGSAWNFGCAIDDIGISDEPFFTPYKSYGLALGGGALISDIQPNLDYTVEGLVFNDGSTFQPETITSFELEFTDNNNNVSSYSFDNVNIEPGGVMMYEIPETFNSGEIPVVYSVLLKTVNGETMETLRAEAQETTLTFAPVSNLNPSKGILVEEATGAWCPWCTRGTAFLNEMTKRFPQNFVGVAVHNADILTLTEYDNGVTSHPDFTGFPSVLYNRAEIMDPSEIVAPTVADAQILPVATIEIGGEQNGTILSTSAKVTFTEAVNANHNVTIVLTEDNLSDPAVDWNQANAYSGGNSGAMGGFEYLAGDISSELVPYDHVGRALIGGYEGVNDIVGEYEVGSSPAVYMPDFSVPADWNTDNMHVVAVLTEASSGEVVNVVSRKYSDVIAAGSVVNTEEILDADLVKLYPNPASMEANMAIYLENSSSVSVDLMDNLGRKVVSQNYGELHGANNLKLNISDVSSGAYIVQIRINDKLVIKKLTVK